MPTLRLKTLNNTNIKFVLIVITMILFFFVVVVVVVEVPTLRLKTLNNTNIKFVLIIITMIFKNKSTFPAAQNTEKCKHKVCLSNNDDFL